MPDWTTLTVEGTKTTDARRWKWFEWAATVLANTPDDDRPGQPWA